MTDQRAANGDVWSVRTVLVILACAIGNIVGVTTIINATFSQFLVPVSHDLGWPRAQFSFVLTLLSLVGVLAYPLAGRCIDRYGSRPVALLGNVLLGASIAALSLMPAVPLAVYALFALVGLAAAGPSTVLFARVVSTWFVRRRGLVLGLSGGVAFGIGGAIVPPVAQWMIDGWGWRGAYLGLGALVCLVGFPVFWFLLHEADVSAPGTTGPTASRDARRSLTRREAFARPAFWILFASVAIGAGSIASLITHIVPIAAEAGIPVGVALTGLACLYGLNALWQIGLGIFLDRAASPRLAALFVLPGAVGVLMLAFADRPATMIAGAALVGLACGTEYGLLPFSIPRYFGFASYGEIYGCIFGAIMLMQGLSPFVLDLVFELTGSYHQALYGVAAALVACSAVLVFLPDFDGEQAAEPENADAPCLAAAA